MLRAARSGFVLPNQNPQSQSSPIIIPDLSSSNKNVLNDIQEKNQVDIKDEHIVEWIKCQKNPLYYIQKYVYFQEIGGRRKYDEYTFHNKFRRVIRCIYQYHMVILLASRQLGKSTIAADIISWVTNFFPNNRAIILNFRKTPAQDNLKKIKFILDNLPSWMRVPTGSRAEIKEYIELQNGSRIDAFYPSTTSAPDTIARSLTTPVLYIDHTGLF